MNLYCPLYHSNWRCMQKKLEVVIETSLEQNLKEVEVTNKMKQYLRETGQINNPTIGC